MLRSISRWLRSCILSASTGQPKAPRFILLLASRIIKRAFDVRFGRISLYLPARCTELIGCSRRPFASHSQAVNHSSAAKMKCKNSTRTFCLAGRSRRCQSCFIFGKSWLQLSARNWLSSWVFCGRCRESTLN